MSRALPAPRTVAPHELDHIASARLAELNHAARCYAHWALQLAYARIRAVAPTAATLTVEVVAGSPARCHLVALRNLAGYRLWSHDKAAPAVGGPLAGIDALLGEVLRWRAPHQLPGWLPICGTIRAYRLDLRAVPPAVDPDLSAGASPGVGLYVADVVVALLAELFNTWLPRVVWALGEYARGLVEGWFPPLTDITAWATVPAILGHPVRAADMVEQLADDQLDDDDWVIGIGSVHGLAAGVLESIDSDESHGRQDALHLQIGVSSEDLAARGFTVAEMASLFQGDVRLTAAVILQARLMADVHERGLVLRDRHRLTRGGKWLLA